MESETKFVELIIVNDRSQVSLAGSNKRTENGNWEFTNVCTGKLGFGVLRQENSLKQSLLYWLAGRVLPVANYMIWEAPPERPEVPLYACRYKRVEKIVNFSI